MGKAKQAVTLAEHLAYARSVKAKKEAKLTREERAARRAPALAASMKQRELCREEKVLMAAEAVLAARKARAEAK